MKNTNLLIAGIVVLLVVGGGAFYLMSMNKGTTPGSTMMENSNGNPSESIGASSNGAMMEETSGSSGAAMMEEGNTKEFTVTGSPFKFDISEMKVKKGDTVKVIFKNAQGMHDWVVDEFNARTKQIPAGQEDTVTFVADKVGTFEYYCSVGNHRQMGMVGKLIVEE